MWEKLNKIGLYTKSYEQFESQFSDEASVAKLYEGLKKQQLYTKTFPEFSKQFFPEVKKKELSSPGLPDSSQSKPTHEKHDVDPRLQYTPEKVTVKGDAIDQSSVDSEQVALEDNLKLKNSLLGTKPGLTEKLEQVIPSFNKGAVSAVAALPKAVGILAQKLDRSLGYENPLSYYETYNLGEWIEEKAAEIGATVTDPNSEGFLNSTIPMALGQVVGTLLMGGRGLAAEKGLEKSITTPLGDLGKKLTSPIAVSGAAQVAVPEYENAIKAGKDEDEAFKVFLKNVPGGLTEVVPIANAFGRLNKLTGGGLINALKAGTANGLEEMSQEAVQQYYTNLIAQGSYDPGRDPMMGVAEGAGAGFFVGFILPGLAAAMQTAPEPVRTATMAQVNEAINENYTQSDIKPQDEIISDQKGNKTPIQEETEAQQDPEIQKEQQNAQTEETQAEVPVETEEEAQGVIGFTEPSVINRDYKSLKEKMGEKKAQKYFKQADRLINPNENTVVEYRENGIVTEDDGKYIFHALADTDTKDWRIAFTQDVTDQFVSDQEQISIEPPIEQTVSEFVERIKSGEELTSPEDLQFYENNKKEIEQTIRQQPEKQSENIRVEPEKAQQSQPTDEQSQADIPTSLSRDQIVSAGKEIRKEAESIKNKWFTKRGEFKKGTPKEVLNKAKALSDQYELLRKEYNNNAPRPDLNDLPFTKRIIEAGNLQQQTGSFFDDSGAPIRGLDKSLAQSVYDKRVSLELLDYNEGRFGQQTSPIAETRFESSIEDINADFNGLDVDKVDPDNAYNFLSKKLEPSQPSESQESENVTSDIANKTDENVQDSEQMPGKAQVGDKVVIEHLGWQKKGTIESFEDGKYKVKTEDGTIHRVKEVQVLDGEGTKRVAGKAKPKKSSNIGPNQEGDQGVSVTGHVKPSGLGFALPFDFGVFDKAGRLIKKYFTSEGLLPKSAFKLVNESQAQKSSDLKRTKFLISDLEKAVSKDFKNPTDKDYALMNEVLVGKQPYSSVPQKTVEALKALRDHVTYLQNELMKSGAVQGDLLVTIEESKGTYLTRSYRVHDDPDNYKQWLAENPEGQKIRNKAIAFIRSKFPNDTDAEIEGKINELLYKEDAPMAILKGGKLGSKDLGILTKRGDIAPEIRALLGEYTNPIVNYTKSVLKMSNLIANHKLQENLRNDGLGKYFFEKPVGKFHVEVASPGSKTMDALTNGKKLYTSPDIAEVIREWNAREQNPVWLDGLYKIIGVAKYMKTIGSTSTHARNMVGSGLIALANGHVFDGAGKFGSATKATVTSLFSLSDQQLREKLIKYTNLGVLGESHQAGFIRDIVGDINENINDPGQFYNSRFKKAMKKGKTFIESMYQAEDDIFKVFAFENELARYSKAYAEELQSGQMTQEQLEQQVATIVRRTFPTYSLTPLAVKALRRFPFMSSFPTFTAEMIRTTWNTAHLIQEELANPKTRSIGAKRAAGFLTAMGGSYALAAFLRDAFDVTDDESEALGLLGPHWAEHGQKLFTAPRKDGKYEFVDLSYSDPYSYFKRPIHALLRGDDLKDAAINSAQELFQPFLSEDLMTSKLMDLRGNQDQNGRRIYNPEADFGDTVRDVYKYLAKAVEPGTVRSIKRVYGALEGTGADYGKDYDLQDELVFMLAGQRKETMDPKRQYYFKVSEISTRLDDAFALYKDVKYRFDEGKATKEELAQARDKAKKARESIKNEFDKLTEAARILGVGGVQIEVIKEKAGIANKLYKPMF